MDSRKGYGQLQQKQRGYLILVPTVPTFYLLDVGLRLIPIRAGFPVYRKNQESTSLADSDQDLKWQLQSVSHEYQ